VKEEGEKIKGAENGRGLRKETGGKNVHGQQPTAGSAVSGELPVILKGRAP